MKFAWVRVTVRIIHSKKSFENLFMFDLWRRNNISISSEKIKKGNQKSLLTIPFHSHPLQASYNFIQYLHVSWTVYSPSWQSDFYIISWLIKNKTNIIHDMIYIHIYTYALIYSYMYAHICTLNIFECVLIHMQWNIF